MVSPLIDQLASPKSRRAVVPVETLGVDLLPPAPRVAEGDAPMFSLLRRTVGLPRDDGRWWPEQEDFEVPSTTLLERTLAGLRAWEPTASVTAVRPPGRHRRVAG